MKEVTDPREIQQHEQELYENRLQEQKDKEDYYFDDDGMPEKCECGYPINSHGHCPRCDY